LKRLPERGVSFCFLAEMTQRRSAEIHAKNTARIHMISSSRHIPRADHDGLSPVLQNRTTPAAMARMSTLTTSASIISLRSGLNCARKVPYSVRY
jgi:hypothetical protein